MNAVDLKAALDTVEQDHQLVVDKLLALKETVANLLEPMDTKTADIVTRLAESNRFFATQFEAHLQDEEATLFPLLEKHVDGGSEVVAQLLHDHEAIRRLRGEFEDCLEIAMGLENHVTRSVLLDLVTYGLDFWEQLDRHAHVESQEVHRCLLRPRP